MQLKNWINVLELNFGNFDLFEFAIPHIHIVKWTSETYLLNVKMCVAHGALLLLCRPKPFSARRARCCSVEAVVRRSRSLGQVRGPGVVQVTAAGCGGGAASATLGCRMCMFLSLYLCSEHLLLWESNIFLLNAQRACGRVFYSARAKNAQHDAWNLFEYNHIAQQVLNLSSQRVKLNESHYSWNNLLLKKSKRANILFLLHWHPLIAIVHLSQLIISQSWNFFCLLVLGAIQR